LKNNENNFLKYNDLKIKLHPEVYEPAEDTYLLVDSFDIKKDEKILEIGTGTGLIALNCAKKGANVICTDINPYSLEITNKNIEINKNIIKGSIEVIYSDLFSNIKNKEIFDIIIFNPPYLPTSKDEIVGGSGWFDKAVDGGKTGLNVTKRFIEEINGHLKKDGSVFLIYSSLSDRNNLEKIIRDNVFSYDIVNKCFFETEKIFVYRLYYNNKEKIKDW